jgi:chromosome segregation ATPase
LWGVDVPDRRDELTTTLRRLREWAASIQRVSESRITSPTRDSFLNLAAMFESTILTVARELEGIRKDLSETARLADASQRKLAGAVSEQIQAINAKLEETDKKWKTIVDEQRRSADEKFAALRQEVTSVAKNAESALRQHVALKRQVRMIQAPGMNAEIDDWAAGQAELGVQVAEGRKAAHHLRDMTDTQELAARIARYRDEDAAYRRHLRDAVTAARDLVTLDPTTSRRALAEVLDRWAGNRTEATRLAQKLPFVAAEARRAQDDLDLASQEKADLQHRADLGERAERILYENIDAYLYPVLNGGLVLPIWLDLALGCGIAGRDWSDWLDTAIRLIRYRIVYRVPLGCDALGPRPTGDGPQCAEYDQLRADCAAYRL